MIEAGRLPLRREVTRRHLSLLLVVMLGLVVLARSLEVGRAGAADTFVVIAISIIVEAIPFVLMGALVSAALEVFVSEATFARIGRFPVPLQITSAAFGGFAFPVCECGSVPVARRLIARGVHPAAGLAFMLASPILNPIVLWSTYVAYQGRGLHWQMVGGRAGLGLVLALAAGWAIGGGVASDLLRRSAVPRTLSDHLHEGGKGRAFVEHLSQDFTFMAKFVIAGGLLAGALQTSLPRDLITSVASTPVLGSVALMAVAFVMSLCSEADAFVAVSFTQFPLGSQLAFLVFGPVVDAKLAFLYGATFRRNFVLRLIVVSVPVTLAGSLWFEVFLR